MIQLFDGWFLRGPCPHCGGKTKWIRNFVHFQEGSVLDVGHYECLECLNSSELHRFRLESVDH